MSREETEDIRQDIIVKSEKYFQENGGIDNFITSLNINDSINEWVEKYFPEIDGKENFVLSVNKELSILKALLDVQKEVVKERKKRRSGNKQSTHEFDISMDQIPRIIEDINRVIGSNEYTAFEKKVLCEEGIRKVNDLNRKVMFLGYANVKTQAGKPVVRIDFVVAIAKLYFAFTGRDYIVKIGRGDKREFKNLVTLCYKTLKIESQKTVVSDITIANKKI